MKRSRRLRDSAAAGLSHTRNYRFFDVAANAGLRIFTCVLGMFFRPVGFENPDAKIVQTGVMLGYTFKESGLCCFRAPGERILPTTGPVT